MKLDILAIGVHPDDIEMGAGGTLLKQIALGHSVGLLDLTRGELGSRGSAEIRKEESTHAAELMGARVRVQLGLADGFSEINRNSLLRIIQIIRTYRPEIILANAIKDRHSDHGHAAKMVYRACFLSGLVKIETPSSEEAIIQEPWRPKALYNYIQDKHLSADFVVDISDHMDAKMDLIRSYKSQFFDPDSTSVETPLTGADFFEYLRAKAKVYGRPVGFKYGEGFTVNRDIGVVDLFDLI